MLSALRRRFIEAHFLSFHLFALAQWTQIIMFVLWLLSPLVAREANERKNTLAKLLFWLLSRRHRRSRLQSKKQPKRT